MAEEDDSQAATPNGTIFNSDVSTRRGDPRRLQKLRESQSADLATDGNIAKIPYVFKAGIKPYPFYNSKLDQIGVFEFGEASRDSCASGRGSARLCDSTPRFHPGPNISPCGTTASFDLFDIYVTEPIPPDHQVAFEIAKIDGQGNEQVLRNFLIGIGFTNIHPENLRDHEVSRSRCLLSEHNTCLSLGDVLSYYHRSDGKVHFAVNGQYKGTFSDIINVQTPKWAFVHIYTGIKSIKLVNPVLPLPLPPLESVQESLPNKWVSQSQTEPLASGLPSSTVATTMSPSTVATTLPPTVATMLPPTVGSTLPVSLHLSERAAANNSGGVLEIGENEARNSNSGIATASHDHDSLAGESISRSCDSTPRFLPNCNISSCGTIASFGCAFSADPIPPDHQVSLQIVDMFDFRPLETRQMIDIGFIKFVDENKTITFLPFFNKGEPLCFKSLTENDPPLCKSDILSYYYRSDGKVHFAVNGKVKGTFPHSIDVGTPVRAAIKIFSKIKTIKFVKVSSSALPLQQSMWNLQTQFRSLALNELSTSQCSPSTSVPFAVSCTTGVNRVPSPSLPNDTQSDSNLNVLTSSASSIDDLKEISATSAQILLKPLALHTKRGRLALTTEDGVVFRKGFAKRGAYVFTKDPVTAGQCILIEIFGLDQYHTEPMHVGFTSCNPETLRDMPDRVHEFSYRPEYWIQSTICEDPPASANEKLEIVISGSGSVMASRNASASSLLLTVDMSEPLWAYFDVYGRVKKINLKTSAQRLVESQASNSSQNTLTATSVLPNLQQAGSTTRSGSTSTDRTLKHQNGSYRRLVICSDRSSNIIRSRERVLPGQTVVFQALGYVSLPLHVSFGFTTSDPITEGLIRHKCGNFLEVQPRDEIAVRLAPEGIVTWRRNDSLPMRLTNADVTSPLWACAIVRQLAEQPTKEFPTDLNPADLLNLWISEPPPSSTLSNSEIDISSDSDDSEDLMSVTRRCIRRLTRPKVTEEPKKENECMICLDNPVNSALIDCGHMCMCFECAKRCGEICPVCRARIKSVLRIYA